MKNILVILIANVIIAFCTPIQASASSIKITGDSHFNTGLFLTVLFKWAQDQSNLPDIYDFTADTQAKRDGEMALVDAGVTDPETAPNFHDGDTKDFTFDIHNISSGDQIQIDIYNSDGNLISNSSISGLDPDNILPTIDALDTFIDTMDQNLKDLGYPGGLTPIPEPATMLLMGSGLVGLAAARRKKKA